MNTNAMQKQDMMGAQITQHVYPQKGQSEKQIADAAANRLLFVLSR